MADVPYCGMIVLNIWPHPWECLTWAKSAV